MKKSELFIQIYNKNKKSCQNLYHIQINPRPISALWAPALGREGGGGWYWSLGSIWGVIQILSCIIPYLFAQNFVGSELMDITTVVTCKEVYASNIRYLILMMKRKEMWVAVLPLFFRSANNLATFLPLINISLNANIAQFCMIQVHYSHWSISTRWQ